MNIKELEIVDYLRQKKPEILCFFTEAKLRKDIKIRLVKKETYYNTRRKETMGYRKEGDDDQLRK